MDNLRGRRLFFGVAAVIWAAGIFWVSSIPSAGLPENLGIWTSIGHFMEYLALSVLIFLSVHKPGRIYWKTAVITLVTASLYGASDEFHQLFVDGRQADVLDWLTDTIGAAAGIVSSVIYVRVLGYNYRKVKTMDNAK
jgi:VanZ family protein